MSALTCGSVLALAKDWRRLIRTMRLWAYGYPETVIAYLNVFMVFLGIYEVVELFECLTSTEPRRILPRITHHIAAVAIRNVMNGVGRSTPSTPTSLPCCHVMAHQHPSHADYIEDHFQNDRN